MGGYNDPLDALVADPVAFARQAAGTAEIERRLREQEAELRAQRIERALDGDPVTRDRWRRTNVDPEFLKWLALEDPLAGVPRQRLLKNAEQVGATDRIVAIFRAYHLMQQVPAAQRTAKPQPFEGQVTPGMITERDLVPRKIWRRAQIARFYEDVRKGH